MTVQNVATVMENSMGSKKWSYHMIQKSHFLGIYQKELKPGSQRDINTPIFIVHYSQ